MKIPYKCKSKRDLDIIFNKHELFDKGDWLYEEIEHRGNCLVCKSDTCECCNCNFKNIDAKYYLREKKLERICNDLC